MRVRWRSHPAVDSAGGALVGAGGAAAVDPGQLPQPLAFQPFQQPPQHQDPVGGVAVGERVQVFGGALVDGGGQAVEAPSGWDRMCVRVHGRKLPHPPTNTTPEPRSVDYPGT